MQKPAREQGRYAQFIATWLIAGRPDLSYNELRISPLLTRGLLHVLPAPQITGSPGPEPPVPVRKTAPQLRHKREPARSDKTGSKRIIKITGGSYYGTTRRNDGTRLSAA